jgi:hypothetical protein
MTVGKRSLPAFALVFAMTAVWVVAVPASWAQSKQGKDYGSRKNACGCFVCGTPLYVVFPNADSDCAGILAESACPESLAGLSQEQRQAFCQKVRAAVIFGSFKESCPTLAPYCGPDRPPDKDPASGGGASLPTPANPDRDGLGDGFGGPPSAPPKGGVSPPRLAYLIVGAPGGGKPVTAFTVYLDRAACPLPLAASNQPSDPAAATHVVRGRILRVDGRVRIEAEASDMSGAAKRGPFVGEASGEGAAAVSTATRAMTKQMNLVCRR